ncbi:hypothetical protein [Paenibacillus sp. AGC30]
MAVIQIGDLEISNAMLTPLEETISPTGKTLKAYEAAFVLNGTTEHDIYKEMQGTVIDFEVLTSHVKFNAKLENVSTSYSGYMGADTTISIRCNLIEYDPDLPEKHDITATALAIQVKDHVHLHALTLLLIEKGIFSKQEFEEAYEKVRKNEQETKAIQNEIIYGITPKYDANEQE